MNNKEVENNNSYNTNNIYESEININQNILYLFKNFLIKENY